ncbi:MAG: hypothetical protein AB7R69_03355 [Candidatus Babeliales bacterium]
MKKFLLVVACSMVFAVQGMDEAEGCSNCLEFLWHYFQEKGLITPPVNDVQNQQYGHVSSTDLSQKEKQD